MLRSTASFRRRTRSMVRKLLSVCGVGGWGGAELGRCVKQQALWSPDSSAHTLQKLFRSTNKLFHPALPCTSRCGSAAWLQALAQSGCCQGQLGGATAAGCGRTRGSPAPPCAACRPLLHLALPCSPHRHQQGRLRGQAWGCWGGGGHREGRTSTACWKPAANEVQLCHPRPHNRDGMEPQIGLPAPARARGSRRKAAALTHVHPAPAAKQQALVPQVGGAARQRQGHCEVLQPEKGVGGGGHAGVVRDVTCRQPEPDLPASCTSNLQRGSRR